MSGIIPLEDIIIEDRQRQSFDETFIAELAQSITEVGLLQPIVLREDEKTLIAGENRVRAIRLIDSMGEQYSYEGYRMTATYAPFITIAELPPHLQIQAELDENRRRKNLTVQEEALAIARFHQLRQELLGDSTLRDTADELDGVSPHTVSDALVIAEHMDIPEVAKAKTKGEALKVIEKRKTAEHHKRLAQEFDSEKQTRKHVLRNEDCMVTLTAMPANCVDVTCTDPLYGIGAGDFGSQSSAQHKYDDSYEYWQGLMPSFLSELYRVSKSRSHAYIFCDYRRFVELSEYASQAGWSPWPRPLIWYKRNGMLPRPEHGPRYTYETILFLNKGDRPTVLVKDDVLDVSPIANPRWGPEKPVELFVDLLGRSVVPGNHVADFFAGTGPILPAANRLKCIATAVELDEEPFGILTQRADNTEEYDGANT